MSLIWNDPDSDKGKNLELMESCKTLRDYAEYTWRVRTYAKEQPLEEAVERAITECIGEGILSEFLSKNRAEAKKVSIFEYDEEKHMRQTREEGWKEGELNAIKKIMESFHISAEKAMETLGVPEGDRGEYFSDLEK